MTSFWKLALLCFISGSGIMILSIILGIGGDLGYWFWFGFGMLLFWLGFWDGIDAFRKLPFLGWRYWIRKSLSTLKAKVING